MSATLGEWAQWMESTEAALGLFIAVIGGLFSGWFTWHQRTLARRERAADLFDRFYSLENYHAMIAPVYVITLKWKALGGEARAAYAAALCRGWAGRDRAAELIAAWDPDYDAEASRADVAVFEAAHFRRSRTGDGVTGHAALTAFLYFWVKLDAMLDAGLVAEGLVRQLFGEPYRIYAQFLADFRQAVVDNPETTGGTPPWIAATRNLERLLLGEALVPERIDWSARRSPTDEAPTIPA